MTTKSPTAPPPAKKKESTVVFGEDLERNNYLKTPKALILIKAFDDPVAKKLKARHIHLILVLAAKKFQNKLIRYYWFRLAQDLGVKVDAARKTAYELKNLGLIRIRHFTGKTKLKAPLPKPGAKPVNPGRRNDANGFDIRPMIDLITRAKVARKAAKEAARKAALDAYEDDCEE